MSRAQEGRAGGQRFESVAQTQDLITLPSGESARVFLMLFAIVDRFTLCTRGQDSKSLLNNEDTSHELPTGSMDLMDLNDLDLHSMKNTRILRFVL